MCPIYGLVFIVQDCGVGEKNALAKLPMGNGKGDITLDDHFSVPRVSMYSVRSRTNFHKSNPLRLSLKIVFFFLAQNWSVALRCKTLMPFYVLFVMYILNMGYS